MKRKHGSVWLLLAMLTFSEVKRVACLQKRGVALESHAAANAGGNAPGARDRSMLSLKSGMRDKRDVPVSDIDYSDLKFGGDEGDQYAGGQSDDSAPIEDTASHYIRLPAPVNEETLQNEHAIMLAAAKQELERNRGGASAAGFIGGGMMRGDAAAAGRTNGKMYGADEATSITEDKSSTTIFGYEKMWFYLILALIIIVLLDCLLILYSCIIPWCCRRGRAKGKATAEARHSRTPYASKPLQESTDIEESTPADPDLLDCCNADFILDEKERTRGKPPFTSANNYYHNQHQSQSHYGAFEEASFNNNRRQKKPSMTKLVRIRSNSPNCMSANASALKRKPYDICHGDKREEEQDLFDDISSGEIMNVLGGHKKATNEKNHDAMLNDVAELVNVKAKADVAAYAAAAEATKKDHKTVDGDKKKPEAKAPPKARDLLMTQNTDDENEKSNH